MRVLLIEDDESDVFLVREILAQTKGVELPGFELLTASTLAEGIRRFEDSHPDLILLDLMLPDSRGMDTLKRMIARAGKTPVVVMSGLTDEALSLESARCGAQDFVLKGHVESMWLSRIMRFAVLRRPPGTLASEPAPSLKS